MNNGTVLLVEDFDNDVILLQRFWRLEEVGNPLEIVADGQQALDYLAGRREFANRTEHPVPRLVLLDLKLPLVGGLEILKWMRSQPELQNLPVLVISTSGLRRDVDEAYRLGTNGFVVKPSKVADLRQLVRWIRDFWLKDGGLTEAALEAAPAAFILNPFSQMQGTAPA
jgi:CheY-like chemotaxis protein